MSESHSEISTLESTPFVLPRRGRVDGPRFDMKWLKESRASLVCVLRSFLNVFVACGIPAARQGQGSAWPEW